MMTHLTKESKHIGTRMTYIVEQPFISRTYSGVVTAVEHPGTVVKNKDGLFRGAVFTLRLDDGSVVNTSVFADYEYPAEVDSRYFAIQSL